MIFVSRKPDEKVLSDLEQKTFCLLFNGTSTFSSYLMPNPSF